MRRSREAWLAAITAALGIAEGCHHDAATTNVAAAPDASALSVAASAPSAAESVAVVESAAPSALPSASVVRQAAPAATGDALLRALESTTPPVDVLQAICGASVQMNPNPLGTGTGIGTIGNLHAACGAPANPDRTVVSPTATVSANAPNASNDDQRTVARMVARMRVCANRGLQSNPTEQGTIHATVAVAANGEVAVVDGVTNTGLSASTQACMVQQMLHMQFATAPEHKVPVVVTSVKRP